MPTPAESLYAIGGGASVGGFQLDLPPADAYLLFTPQAISTWPDAARHIRISANPLSLGTDFGSAGWAYVKQAVVNVVASNRFAHLDLHCHSGDDYQKAIFGILQSDLDSNVGAVYHETPTSLAAQAAHKALFVAIAQWAASEGLTPAQFGIGFLNEPMLRDDFTGGANNKAWYYGTFLPDCVTAARVYLPTHFIFVPILGASSPNAVAHLSGPNAEFWDLPDAYCVNEIHDYRPNFFSQAGPGTGFPYSKLFGLRFPKDPANVAFVSARYSADPTVTTQEKNYVLPELAAWGTDGNPTDAAEIAAFYASLPGTNPWLVGEMATARGQFGRSMPKDAALAWETAIATSTRQNGVRCLLWTLEDYLLMGSGPAVQYDGTNAATATIEGDADDSADRAARSSALWGETTLDPTAHTYSPLQLTAKDRVRAMIADKAATWAFLNAEIAVALTDAGFVGDPLANLPRQSRAEIQAAIWLLESLPGSSSSTGASVTIKQGSVTRTSSDGSLGTRDRSGILKALKARLNALDGQLSGDYGGPVVVDRYDDCGNVATSLL